MHAGNFRAPSSPPHGRNSLPILVLSSDPEDVQALRAILAPAGWIVRPATGVEEAVAALRAQPSPVIITEHRLGSCGWKGLQQRIQEMNLRPAPRLIIASRGADEALWAEVLSSGCYDLLIKPFSEDEVCWTVGYASEEWWREQERPEQGHTLTSIATA